MSYFSKINNDQENIKISSDNRYAILIPCSEIYTLQKQTFLLVTLSLHANDLLITFLNSKTMNDSELISF